MGASSIDVYKRQAFRKAMEIGADGVEMDVQQTSDKKLVIHHDFVIDWHTDMRGQIYDMTEGLSLIHI